MRVLRLLLAAIAVFALIDVGSTQYARPTFDDDDDFGYVPPANVAPSQKPASQPSRPQVLLWILTFRRILRAPWGSSVKAASFTWFLGKCTPRTAHKAQWHFPTHSQNKCFTNTSAESSLVNDTHWSHIPTQTIFPILEFSELWLWPKWHLRIKCRKS